MRSCDPERDPRRKRGIRSLGGLARLLVGTRAHNEKVTDDPGEPDGERFSDLVQPGRPPVKPFTGQIARVTGRRARGGGPGQPALDELVLHNDDGAVLEFGPYDNGEQDTLTGIAEIQPGRFHAPGGTEPMCPICLEPDATHREHVPQAPLGGRAMTWTCRPCNNGLGSKVEVDLQHWFDHALVNTAFDHDGDVPGRRRVPPMYFRKQVGGDASAMFIDGEFTPEVQQMMATGEWRMHYRPPDPRRWGMGLLKHSFLAACLFLRSVLDTAEVDAIRADLITARDSDRRSRPPKSEAVERLKVYRSGVGRQGPPLALMASRRRGDSEPEALISLAGVLFVTWPFADLPAGTWQQAASA